MTTKSTFSLVFLFLMTVGLCGSVSAQNITLVNESQTINGDDPSGGFLEGDDLVGAVALQLDNTNCNAATTFWVRSKWLGLDGNPIAGTTTVDTITLSPDSAAALLHGRGLENVSYGGQYTLLIEWGIGQPSTPATGGTGLVFFGGC